MTDTNCLVLEINAWNNFLLPHVLGHRAHRYTLDFTNPKWSDYLEQTCADYSQFALHIDLSNLNLLPRSFLGKLRNLSKQGNDVINLNYLNITKRFLRKSLLLCNLPSLYATNSGPPDELLIIKTDLNFGGLAEQYFYSDDTLQVPHSGYGNYRVCYRKDIPIDLWTTPEYYIERYISNTNDAIFRVYFARSSLVIVHAHSNGYIKKVSGDDRDSNYLLITDYNESEPYYDDLPSSLIPTCLTYLKHARLDFGSLDVVYNDLGSCYIVDVNRTPWAGNRPLPIEILAFLGLGIKHH